jgi:hypothetical protein
MCLCVTVTKLQCCLALLMPLPQQLIILSASLCPQPFGSDSTTVVAVGVVTTAGLGYQFGAPAAAASAAVTAVLAWTLSGKKKCGGKCDKKCDKKCSKKAAKDQFIALDPTKKIPFALSEKIVRVNQDALGGVLGCVRHALFT